MPPDSKALDGPPLVLERSPRSLWLKIAGGVVGGVLLRVLVIFGPELPRVSAGFVFRLVIAFLLSVVVHEAGHVIAGALVGFRVLVLAIRPLKLYRRQKGWRLGWTGRTRLAGFYVPDPAGTHNLEKRMYFMVAAGPVASALAGIACVGSAILAQPDWPRWLVSQLNLIACWSLFLAVVNMLPPRRRAGPNVITDGERLRILRRGGEEAGRFCSLLLLGAASMSGVRPRDWNPELVERLGLLVDESPDGISAQCFRYNWLLDTEQIEKASEALSWVVARTLPKEVQSIFWLEAGWFQARFRDDPVAARRWMEAAQVRMKTAEEQCSYWKFQAALAVLEKRRADAEEAARKGLQQCPRLANVGVASAIRGEFDRVLEEAAGMAR